MQIYLNLPSIHLGVYKFCGYKSRVIFSEVSLQEALLWHNEGNLPCLRKGRGKRILLDTMAENKLGKYKSISLIVLRLLWMC